MTTIIFMIQNMAYARYYIKKAKSL